MGYWHLAEMFYVNTIWFVGDFIEPPPSLTLLTPEMSLYVYQCSFWMASFYTQESNINKNNFNNHHVVLVVYRKGDPRVVGKTGG